MQSNWLYLFGLRASVNCYFYVCDEMLQGIIVAMWRGFLDSLRGGLVLFSMDKQINERMRKASSKTDARRRDSSVTHSPAKYSKHHR